MATKKAEQVTTAAAAAAHAARQALAAVRDSEQELRSRHAALVVERRATEAALRDRAGVLADVDRLVDEVGERWLALRAQTIADHVSGALRESATRAELRRQRPALPDFGPLNLEALCALAPDSVRHQLRAAVDGLAEKNFGLPEDGRSARLAELDAEVAAVERDHEALVVAASEAGLELRHLDTTASRLRAEREAAEREAELARQREFERRVAAGEDRFKVERELFPPPPLRSAVVPVGFR